MKRRRSIKWMSLLCCCTVLSVSASSGNPQVPSQSAVRCSDPYSLQEVQSLLSTSKEQIELKVGSSFVAKQLGRRVTLLGDGFSIGVLKTVGGRQLTEPVTAKAYLVLARLSFSQTDRIVLPENKNPTATLFLLEFVRERVDDPQLKTQVESAIAYVEKATSDLSLPAR